MKAVGRVIVCTRCRAACEVLEAASAARTLEEHRFLDPAAFVCGGCLEQSGQVVQGALSAATLAAGRARTAQSRQTGSRRAVAQIVNPKEKGSGE